MAIDTAAKRRSIPGVSFYAGLTNPVADGTIGTSDRQHTGYGYVGIAADTPPAGRIMSSLAASGGLAGMGGIAGKGGGLAG